MAVTNENAKHKYSILYNTWSDLAAENDSAGLQLIFWALSLHKIQ